MDNVVAVAAGYAHSLFIRRDGTLWGMGLNNGYQLGDGTTTNQKVPGLIASDVMAAVAGIRHTLFLKTDGTLWAMGANFAGEVGDGTTNSRTVPVQVASNVVAMAAAQSNSLFVKADGSLWGMGDNSSSQLGGATTASSVSNPVQLAAGGVTAAATCGSHSLFLQSAGMGTMPVITTQPAAALKAYGEPATFSVTASGGGPLDYQWFRNGVEIAGARSTTLFIPAVLDVNIGSYSVRVTNSAGEATSTAVVLGFETFAQTITFGPIANRTYGDAAFVLGATASSGLPVGYAVVSGPATVSGGTLSITGAGTVTVRAFQTGDGTYSAATPVEQTFTVAKAVPAVTWMTPVPITYGTAVGATQLNASTAVPGTFTYTPAAGVLPNAGSQTLSFVFAPADATNYAAATGSVTLTVNPKAITASFTVANKVYDGTTAATVTSRSLSGLVGSDDVQLTGGTAAFNTKDVGTGKTVTLAGATLGGAKAGNYTLGSVSTTTATVTARPVTVGGLSASNKVYDGTVAATLTGVLSVGGAVSGETVTVTGTATAATFAQPGAGVGIAVAANLAGLTLSSPNYTITGVTTPLAANITAKELTIAGLVASNKVYDGLVAATLIGTPSLNGVVAADDVKLTGVAAGAFGNANAGPNKVVAVTGLSLDGTAKGNYTLTLPTLTAAITKAPLTVKAENKSKVYDGAVFAGGFTAVYTGLLNGESAAVLGGALSYTGSALTSVNAGSYAVTPVGLTSGNYEITFTAGEVTINRRPLSITANGDSKAFGSTRTYGAGSTAFTSSGLVSGETIGSVTITASGGTAATDAPGSYTLVPSAATGGTFQAGNYDITYLTGTLVVGAGSQAISFGAIANKVYGDIPFPLGATATSGLPVTYAVLSGPATESGGMLTITGAGTVTVRASQPGDGSFSAATPVERTFTVAKATLVVRADDKTKVQGAPNPEFTITYSGFVNQDTKGVITEPVISTPALSDSAPGTYAITLTGGAAANYTLSLQDGTLTVFAYSAPVFTLQPQSQSITAAGGSVTFVSAASGSPAPSYQWYFNGVPVTGATDSSLTLPNVQPAAVGRYSVTATNGAGSATSAIVSLEIKQPGNAATQAVVGSGYVPGARVTISASLAYAGSPSSLSWAVLLPPGWSFASSTASGTTAAPQAGQAEVLEWSWSVPPASPVSFSYTLNVPAGQVGLRELVALAGVNNGQSLQFLAQPDPLAVSVSTAHSADLDQNGRIALVELTRVIELYNTRNGTTRTGCYAVTTTSTEDGFVPAPERTSSAAISLGRYHSADSSRDGRITLTELTRVIELYNYRSGTTRTGQYKIKAGTEDGFEPGP